MLLLCSSIHITISEIEYLLSLKARKLVIVIESDKLIRPREKVALFYFKVSPVLQHLLDGTWGGGIYFLAESVARENESEELKARSEGSARWTTHHFQGHGFSYICRTDTLDILPL
jgi:hypothetical protein